MSNTLTGLIPTIYEALDVVTRELVGAIPAVNRDTDVARAAVGQPITVPVAPPATASDIVPAVTPPNDGDQVFSNYTITIDNAKRVPIRWNGEEQRGLSNGGVGFQRLIRDQWAQGLRTLVNSIELDLMTKLAAKASRATGTPGTTPFGTPADFMDFANAHTILDENGAPMADRQMILGSSAMGNLRGKQSVLFKANEAGTDQLLRDGIVARVEGFDLHNTAQQRLKVKGTGASYLVNASGGLAAGVTTIPVDGGTGTILAGDVISIAGDTNKYVVVSALGAGTSITIGSPGLRTAIADNAAITVENSYVPNIALSRSAGILATRTPALPIGMDGQAMDMATDRTTVTDPVSGLSFEVSEYRQYRQVQYELAIVWGFNVIKEDFVAILRG